MGTLFIVLFYIFLYGIIGSIVSSLTIKYCLYKKLDSLFGFYFNDIDDTLFLSFLIWVLWPLWVIVLILFILIGYIPYYLIYKKIVGNN